MVFCDYCKRKIVGVLPHKCKFCHRIHCTDHLLPELHECKKLPHGKWPGGTTQSIKLKPQIDRPEHPISPPRPEPRNQKDIFSIFAQSKFKHWLNSREHHKYDWHGRLTCLVTTALIFVASIVALRIFYFNANELNTIKLWIIKLAGILLLISLFFIIKYGWKLIEEVPNILKRQKNWLKYLVILIVLILLWQAYNHKTDVLNPVFDAYNKTNFSLFVPINFGNFSFDSTTSSSPSYVNTNKTNTGMGGFISGIIDQKSQIDILALEEEVHRLINIERTNNGLTLLSLDSKLANIARAHSQDIVARNFFAHDNPDGQDPTARATAAGYSCYKNYGSYYTNGIAENIAETPIYSDVIGCGSTTSLGSLAKCIVDRWMSSSGHRQNILTSTYSKEGIGIAYSSDNKAYTTEDFC